MHQSRANCRFYDSSVLSKMHRLNVATVSGSIGRPESSRHASGQGSQGRDASAAPALSTLRCLQPSHWDCLRSGIDAMKRVLMLALVRGAAPLLAPRHAVRSFARRPAPKKRPSVSMALCVAASRKRIYAPRRVALPTPSTRAQRLCREMPHADAIDARVDDTVSTQARPPRSPKTRTNCTTAAKREDHPALTKSRCGSGRGG